MLKYINLKSMTETPVSLVAEVVAITVNMKCVICALSDRWVQHFYLKKRLRIRCRRGEREMTTKNGEGKGGRQRETVVCEKLKKTGQTMIKLVCIANQTEQAKDRRASEQESKR